MRHLIKKKSLDCLEKDIGRNTNIRVYSAEDLELVRAMKKASDNLENTYIIIKYIYQQNIPRNRNVKCAPGKVPERNEEYAIGYTSGMIFDIKWQTAWLNCVPQIE